MSPLYDLPFQRNPPLGKTLRQFGESEQNGRITVMRRERGGPRSTSGERFVNEK